MRKTGRAALVVSCCLSLKVALAHAASEPIEPIRDPQASDIVIPADLGYLIETHEPASPDHPLIVHIQEAHTNYEAQQHIVAILERLIQTHGLKLILVEGGEGDVSLSYLRGFGSPDNRKTVAEKYLKLGILSGEEYLDIVSDHPLTLWGVEREDLYQQNEQAFMDAEALQAAARPALATLRDAVDTLKPVVSDPALLELEAKQGAFEQEQLGLAEFGEFLSGLAKRQGVSEDGYPELRRFLEVYRVEQDLPLDQVQREQQALLQRLSATLEQAELDGLMAKARQMQAGTVTPEAFYAELERLAAASRLDLPQTSPTLSRYIRYTIQSARVVPSLLSNELDQLAERLRATLASSADRQRFSAIDEQVDLVHKLVELALSPEEYERFQALPLEGLCARWERELSELLIQHGLAPRSFDRLSVLQAVLPAIQRFYDAANDRDQALVDNALAKVRDSGERIAVLITGGFHAPRISRLLQEEGAGLVAVAPKVSQATDEQLYQAVLKYKSGRGSLEEVVAVASRASPSATR